MRGAGIPAVACLLVVVVGCAVAKREISGHPRSAELSKTATSPTSLPSGELSDRAGEQPATATTTRAQDSTPGTTDLRLAAAVEAARPISVQEPPEILPQSRSSFTPQNSGSPVELGQVQEQLVGPSSLTLDNVLRSVYDSYPLLQVAVAERRISAGELLAAQGEFDFKLKGGGATGPLGFYETQRFGAGFEQALFGGGQVFGGYRIGRGNFQPWYGERETNDGGEFKAGFLIPLLQNRSIDPRRAAIFRAALGRDAVEPDILLQLIDFVRAAAYTYWDWVAAGQDVQIAQALLDIAQQRQEGLKKRVERGDLARIELTDNERLVVLRRAILIDAQRKLQQSGSKLSLFYRLPDGQPVVVPTTRMPSAFPAAQPYDATHLEVDIQGALSSRPELQFLRFMRAQLDVELAQARNLYVPEMDLGVVGSQDVGAAANDKRDKTPFELEASVLVSVPLQRRKALGKIQAAEGKLNQVTAKARFIGDKISTEVQQAVAALMAAYLRIDQARASVDLNLTMEQAERRRFDQGDSNLLIVNLREQATADARKTLVAALLEYFQAEADYRAALGIVPVPDS